MTDCLPHTRTELVCTGHCKTQSFMLPQSVVVAVHPPGVRGTQVMHVLVLESRVRPLDFLASYLWNKKKILPHFYITSVALIRLPRLALPDRDTGTNAEKAPRTLPATRHKILLRRTALDDLLTASCTSSLC
ncbi:hypothetical protein E2C01_027746 [Portunus trituberculatus]|uniref:Uncharacterized protein n=1 Tax=Portunus trituberculatus TaxID=210409 RepID=A0A5B7EIX9_PORTR|nr:hypothetical protein [Portunus trituberculatus]